MREGDWCVCIDDEDDGVISTTITKGKKYKIIGIDINFFTIYDDNKIVKPYYINRFISLKDYNYNMREKKLKRILYV